MAKLIVTAVGVLMAVSLALLGWMLPKLRVPVYMATSSPKKPVGVAHMWGSAISIQPPLAVGAGSWATADVVVVAGRERCVGSQAREALEPPDAM